MFLQFVYIKFKIENYTKDEAPFKFSIVKESCKILALSFSICLGMLIKQKSGKIFDMIFKKTCILALS